VNFKIEDEEIPEIAEEEDKEFHMDDDRVDSPAVS
jgi:hypothetical protein